MMSPQDVIRKWWLQTARLGMTPSEAADTLMAAISGAGFEITPRKKGRESEPVEPRGPRPRPITVMTNAIAGEVPRRGVFKP